MYVRKLCTAAAAAAALIAGAAPAAAEIQNVQSALATEPPQGLSGSVNASADWRTGNVEFLFVSLAAAARFRVGNDLWIALANIDRKTSGEATIVERTFEHLRYRHILSERWLVEAFAQHEFDGVKRLRIRTLVGVGPRLELLHGKSYGVGLGVAYMFEFEQLQQDMEIDAGDTDLANRASSYLVGSYEVNDNFQLVGTFYVQPRLTDVNDYRLLDETSVVLKATDHISFSTTFVVAYDSRPPATIDSLDTALKSAISISFGGDS